MCGVCVIFVFGDFGLRIDFTTWGFTFPPSSWLLLGLLCAHKQLPTINDATAILGSAGAKKNHIHTEIVSIKWKLSAKELCYPKSVDQNNRMKASKRINLQCARRPKEVENTMAKRNGTEIRWSKRYIENIYLSIEKWSHYTQQRRSMLLRTKIDKTNIKTASRVFFLFLFFFFFFFFSLPFFRWRFFDVWHFIFGFQEAAVVSWNLSAVIYRLLSECSSKHRAVIPE